MDFELETGHSIGSDLTRPVIGQEDGIGDGGLAARWVSTG
jgi:hypothetical protein